MDLAQVKGHLRGYNVRTQDMGKAKEGYDRIEGGESVCHL